MTTGDFRKMASGSIDGLFILHRPNIFRKIDTTIDYDFFAVTVVSYRENVSLKKF